MIVRRWGARAAAGRAHLYPEHFAAVVLPTLRAIPGFLGAYLLRRAASGDGGGEVELVVETLWESREAIVRFAGPAPERAVVDPGAEATLASYDDVVSHYEVLHAALVAPDGAPTPDR